ncbi:methyltransferase domain-containing protein [Streptomyces sp. NPDC005407]|uniref:methyltransferase domain-containing protein n=1 Tax=Streptomyces sp. NPDC005407 TaxID=3155340 RepID=UPI0033B47F37
MSWQQHAAALAQRVTHDESRWRWAVAGMPRHHFVPQWWERADEGWLLRQGPADQEQWLEAAYRDTSLVTRVGPLHADQAEPGEQPQGLPTSSATLPSLIVRMFQHGRIGDSNEVLDVGTGSGYGTALACMRVSDVQVTSIDVDPYLVEAARARLSAIRLHPRVETVDATGELPGIYDRIVSTVGVRPVPASWLAALKPGGRLVTTVAGTTLIITAEKRDDGTARGKVEWDRAGFMRTRHGDDYPPHASALIATARTAGGEAFTEGRYPVINIGEAWDLSSMLEIHTPGVLYGYETDGDRRTTWLAHPDGSWARATSNGGRPPAVHQSGPRGLWDTLDEIRSYWLQHGELPVRGANVLITPEGRTLLARGSWRAAL